MIENDPLLDYDHDKRTVMQLTMAQVERRLADWREKQNDEI